MRKLAVDGGKKAYPHPFPSWPFYAEDEIKAVNDLLRNGKVNQWTSSTVNDFEKACSKAFDQPYAVAVANGSLALELALIAADIGPGDEVIVTPRSFIASVSCVVMRGATPVFADVDMESQNITPETIEAVISPRTKAVIPVHLNGWPCDMPGIMMLAKRYDLYVIEDCAQAHGAKINEKPIGSFGHATAFSFCQDKIMSTGGEGGMVLLRGGKKWRHAWSYKDHGKNFDTVFNKQQSPGFRWLHESFGTNWRMSGMQAVIGLKQIEKLPQWLARRRSNAEHLTKCLSSFSGIDVPWPSEDIEHAWYRCGFLIKEHHLKQGWNRKKIMLAINAEGVPCLETCPEIYKEKAFENFDMPKPNCPNAALLADRACVLLVHPTIDDVAIDNICKALAKVLEKACT